MKHIPLPKITEEITARIWSGIQKLGPDDCWPWLGVATNFGHGRITIRTKFIVTRILYAIVFGSNPGDLCVLHRCDNPKCCNPKHLFLGTDRDNNFDKERKNRANHPRGTNNGRSKLTKAKVVAIRKANEPQRILADRYGISQTQISKIKLKQSWA
jgi:hypothetical protein